MRRIGIGGLALLVMLLVGGTARGQSGTCPPASPLSAFAFETLTAGATAVSFTTATMAAARAAKVQVKTNAANYRDDGTAPAAGATGGFEADPLDVLWVCGASLGRFQAINQTAASSATLVVTYYK